MLGTILARMGPEDGTATEVCIMYIECSYQGAVVTMCGCL